MMRWQRVTRGVRWSAVGVLLVVVGVVSSRPESAVASTVTIVDRLGDSPAPGIDIVEASMDAPASDVATLRVRLASPGVAVIGWKVQAGPPFQSDAPVWQHWAGPRVLVSTSAMSAQVTNGDPDADCSATVTADAAQTTVTTQVSASCLGYLPQLRFSVEVVDIRSFPPDVAPDAGWSPVVVNEAYGVVPPPSRGVEAGSTLRVHVAGHAGVPTTGVAAVSMNVTVDRPQGEGFVTVHACDAPRPWTSNLNFGPLVQRTPSVANQVIAPVSAAGDVCFFVAGATTHLLADVNGWFATGSDFHALSPSRVFDTRDGTGGVAAGAKVGPTAPLAIDVTGRDGVPDDGVAAVSLNVTVTGGDGAGFVTVYPCDAARPWTSNLNFLAGQTLANAVIAPVGAAGRVCFHAQPASTHLLADVNGWFATGSMYTPLTPARVFDTRDSPGAVGELTAVMVGASGVPATGVAAVSLNVTVDQASGGGYVTVHPCVAPPPFASNLNFRPGQTTVAAAVIAPLSATGSVCAVIVGAPAELIADVSGALMAGTGFTALTPTRLFDTRLGGTVPTS